MEKTLKKLRSGRFNIERNIAGFDEDTKAVFRLTVEIHDSTEDKMTSFLLKMLIKKCQNKELLDDLLTILIDKIKNIYDRTLIDEISDAIPNNKIFKSKYREYISNKLLLFLGNMEEFDFYLYAINKLDLNLLGLAYDVLISHLKFMGEDIQSYYDKLMEIDACKFDEQENRFYNKAILYLVDDLVMKHNIDKAIEMVKSFINKLKDFQNIDALVNNLLVLQDKTGMPLDDLTVNALKNCDDLYNLGSPDKNCHFILNKLRYFIKQDDIKKVKELYEGLKLITDCISGLDKYERANDSLVFNYLLRRSGEPYKSFFIDYKDSEYYTNINLENETFASLENKCIDVYKGEIKLSLIVKYYKNNGNVIFIALTPVFPEFGEFSEFVFRCEKGILRINSEV